MKGKIMIMALLCAVLVGLVPPSSAHAEEVQEWSNFAEWCYCNGVDMDDLPIEYDDSKEYLLAQWGTNGSYKYDMLFVWEKGQEPSWKYYAGNSNAISYDIADFVAVYQIEYEKEWFDYPDESGCGWEGVSYSNTYLKPCDSPKYSDVCIEFAPGYGGVGCKWHKTISGNAVDFQFAVADISADLKTKLESYSNYVVAQVPYKLNDWRSEQIMIAVSNGDKVIFRDDSYNQICFTTGTGYESGLTYVYCSNCCYWSEYHNSVAYIAGDSYIDGDGEPSLIYSSCDICYEDGTTYGLTDNLWRSAVPYGSSVDPTPSPSNPAPSNPNGGLGVQEQLLYLYPSDFQGTVVTSYASIYEVTNGSDDDILCDILKGMRVDVHGWTVDSSGATWYYCTYTNIYNGEVTGKFTGFIRGESIGITYGAGDTEEEQDMTLAEQLQIAASFVLSVPLIIGSIFSFLPPWCLTFLGLAFSVTALLMVLRK